MSLIIYFPGNDGPTALNEVGGKGYSLMRMIEAGFPVPPGAVLTTSFFQPWLDEIRASAVWAALTTASPDGWAALCSEIKLLCPGLPLTEGQGAVLSDLVAGGGANLMGGLLAVRSSSPAEDLASASFAGGYATSLGVRPSDLEAAVRTCFASSLDERVLVYKQKHGLDLFSPSLAVIVQRQIDSDVAGVGFSLNPLTNDYDEAVIDANQGLGESVVEGIVSPDHFVVDKVSGAIVQSQIGAKQVSVRLGDDGGTVERENEDAALYCLDEHQIRELTSMIGRIEKFFGAPMDIEWAYESGQLHVLQARPITTYVPLPPEMLTEPGERRRLYADAALSKGMTTNEPFSPMELDWMRDFYSFLEERVGIEASPENGLVFFAGCRMYMSYSNIMWLTSMKKLAKTTGLNDVLMGAILVNIDEGRYRTLRRPPWMRLAQLLKIPGYLWLLRGMLWRLMRALVAPERAYRDYRRKADAYRVTLAGQSSANMTIAEFRAGYESRMAAQMFGVTMPVVGALAIALGLIDIVVGKKSGSGLELAQKLKLGFTGDVVVEMGIALYRLAGLLEPEDFKDINALSARIARRELPAKFMDAWETFQDAYGWRGPLEMDLASPRYADDPSIALRQMSFMRDGFDPERAHRRNVEERKAAYAKLGATLSAPRRFFLRRLYRVINLLGGTRDAPKDEVVLYNFLLRRRVLEEGRRLVGAGRLDEQKEIFNLTFGDVAAAEKNPTLDLRRLVVERTSFLKLLRGRVREFPQVIDSRGRILRPAPRAERPGELTGMAVSTGIASGPVKVLYNPHEKKIEPGDVLVAYTTDPGWTPLFVNAAAVVLEVGGTLQHGALVAREYGKPCVAGIDRVMAKLSDGQYVEVDGNAGVIRILSGDSEESEACLETGQANRLD